MAAMMCHALRECKAPRPGTGNREPATGNRDRQAGGYIRVCRFGTWSLREEALVGVLAGVLR
jgi:hypothetical protein